MSFFKELKERNVVKVAVIYAVTGWLLAQIADLALPAFGAPDWVLRVFLFFLLLGFPVALIMAWALELTPEGIRKAESSAGEKRMWSIAVILVVMVVAWFELGMQKESAPSAQVDSPVAVAAPAQGKAVEEQGVSIAVLPFIDLSSEQDQQFFALGMSEELLNVLAKIDRLEVASRTSAFAFQGSELGAQAIGRQLGVDHVLEGSIRKSGERLRITAQLIDVETDRHLWSDTYDRELADVFDIQDEITSAIVESLREPLGI
ncbi:MAG: adenylyl cyclase, partial [Gammaproteobacteria bacterium]|nr:adenylyl cyclase [Gammaproteobacteria bacterium]